jgi:tRNA uridine 5-carboxymethylaminomethyl modification enzyme
MFPVYDVIVVGGGHAGCEAAAAAARMGSKTLLLTMDMTKYAQMSCNPAIGGIAKGQIVREIDALGGWTGIVADKTTLQFKMLNKSKGPAMWSPRSQNDRTRFSLEWRKILENTDNLDLFQDTAVKILEKKRKVVGLITQMGIEFRAKTVILTNGTFLNGLMHVGKAKMAGGRVGELSSLNISEQLDALGFRTGRLKTGTPVRIDGRSIDFSKLTEQTEEISYSKFSFLPHIKSKLKSRSTWITYTTSKSHEILNSGLEDSPLFDGTIKGVGPRYCPSIESKLITFADKEKHQLFLEPEGEDTNEYYLNGFSSSLPWDIQYKAIKAIPGFENSKIYRPGYAIEYDYFDPTQLWPTLESKITGNLFLAGQINGTTGYEEAAAQGLMAGINAHLKVHEKGKKFILGRDEAYIGVLIDDLVNKGVDEPYRMFTSRAEYRILLRQDNADERLTPKGIRIGSLVSEERKVLYEDKYLNISHIIDYISKKAVKPVSVNELLIEWNTTPIKNTVKLKELLLRPQISIRVMINNISYFKDFIDSLRLGERESEILESVEIKVKYEGYVKREKAIAEKVKKLENIELNLIKDYNQINSLSTEAKQKMNAIKPATVGQASRIPGVSPADINVLLVMLGR